MKENIRKYYMLIEFHRFIQEQKSLSSCWIEKLDQQKWQIILSLDQDDRHWHLDHY